MSQVVMVADELGVDMMPVAIFQVARRVSVVLLPRRRSRGQRVPFRRTTPEGNHGMQDRRESEAL